MSETAASSELAAWSQGPTVEELEQRVQRLEDAVAAMCDTQALEERLRVRLLEQLRKEPIDVVVKPVEASAVKQTAANTSPESQVFDAQTSSDMPLAPAEPRLPVSLTTSDLSALTVFGEMWWEIRTFYCMVRDPLYPFSWMARTAIALPVVYILWHYLVGFLFFPVEIAVVFVLCYLIFKIGGRELRRYQEFVRHRRRR
jgi:hypothetical protein